ncbi:type 1 glutamine amidotransferase [Oceanicella actignis]|uniref:GMP synthase (Glutamine-hydrolysing) n=1 Tax=Oceanicella actignis TaxID=1189325 RepID=A0A1M7S8T5_9RHOB|nr:hypothetical protein [Oceanicella actignis]SET32161.1 GMP synthase (glutamine-hydrolysing) [Oceanicella actignis]SHN54828.1 GMP synthase (glutamine-hydrolysing) [Oceanicella actignis]
MSAAAASGGPRICVIAHHDDPEEDAARAHLRARGARLCVVSPWRGEPTPDPRDFDGAMIMGGPQMVTDADSLPWMRDEQAFARGMLALGRPLLAICLGAQLLADALGARVGPHPEGRVALGFHPVVPTAEGAGLFPPGFMALSGNAQGFALPPGATLLARGEVWPNQAYAIGSALALQFHPEVTPAILEAWKRELADYFGRPGVSDPARLDADFARHDPALKTWLRALLERMFLRAHAPAPGPSVSPSGT